MRPIPLSISRRTRAAECRETGPFRSEGAGWVQAHLATRRLSNWDGLVACSVWVPRTTAVCIPQ